MDILGIGPLELALIAIIILLVLGPKEMVSALRTIGRVLRSVVTSDWWQTTRKAIQDVRKLPYDLMREAGMEEDLQALDEIRQTAAGKPGKQSKRTPPPREPDYAAWTQPPAPQEEPAAEDEESTAAEPNILPPDSQIETGQTNVPPLISDEDPENSSNG